MSDKETVKKRLVEVNKLLNHEIFSDRDLTAHMRLWLSAKEKYDAGLYDEADALLEKIITLLYNPSAMGAGKPTVREAGGKRTAKIQDFYNPSINPSALPSNVVGLFIKTLTSPKDSLEVMATHTPVLESLIFLLAFICISMLLNLGPLLSLSFLFMVIYPILMLLSVVMESVIIHFAAKILKGKGSFRSLFCVNSFSLAPFLVFSLISLVFGFIAPAFSFLWLVSYAFTALLALLGSLVIQCVGVSIVYGISRVRAALAVLLPIGVVLVLLMPLLVFIFIGVTTWQLGIFNMGGSKSLTATGFAKIKPQLAATGITAAGQPRAVFTNGVGTEISLVSGSITDLASGSGCGLDSTTFVPQTVSPGENFKVSDSAGGCVKPGKPGDVYNAKVSITYDITVGTITTRHSEVGTLRGPME